MKSALTFIVFAAIIGGVSAFVFYEYGTSPQVSEVPNADLSTQIFRIKGQLPGEPSFTVTVPAAFSKPIASAEVRTPFFIDPENNVQNLTSYKPDSPHTYPDAGSDIFMNISVFVQPLAPNETLRDIAAKRVTRDAETAYTGTVVDGHPALIQSIGSGTLTYYYIQINAVSALRFLFVGNQKTRDSIISSITFIE